MPESTLAAFGLVVRVVVTDHVPFDPAVVLGALPLAPTDAAAHLTVHVARGPAPHAHTSTPAFFHGTVEGRVVDGEYALTSSVAEVRVARDGSRVDAVVHGELGDESELRLGVPVFIAVAIALRHHGRFHLHAAGLEDQCGSILVVGQQGAGKTSTCLALVEAGAAFVGDDAVFLAEHDDAVVAWGVPKHFHLGDRTIAAFPRLGALCGPAPRGGPPKRPLDPMRAWPQQMRSTLKAPFTFVAPEITASTTTTLEPMDLAEAFGCLLESSALGVADGMPALPAQLALLQRIAGRAWRLKLGADALEQPARVAALVGDRLG